MSRYIIKLDDFYCEWSTIVDAPVSYFMKLGEFKEFYEKKYGSREMRELDERLERVEKYGSSVQPSSTAEEIIRGNCAGDNGKSLNKKELLEKYIDKEEL